MEDYQLFIVFVLGLILCKLLINSCTPVEDDQMKEPPTIPPPRHKTAPSPNPKPRMPESRGY